MEYHPEILGIVVVYFIILLIIGTIASRKVKSYRDFIIATGQFNLLILMGTVIATQWGGVTVMGVPGLGYKEAYRAVYYASAAVPRFLLWALLLAIPIWMARPWTITEWFSQRFDRKNGYLIAILNVLGFIGLIAGQLVATARIFSVMTGLSFDIALLIGALIVIIYTTAAGIYGVAYTDVFQFFIIFAGVLTLAGVAHATIGLETIKRALPPEHWSTLGLDGLLFFITLFILWCADLPFNYVIQRISSARTKRIAFMAPVFGAMSYFIAAYLGGTLGSYAAYVLPGLKATDEAVIRLSIALLPPLIAGLLAAALLAVTMSSADTYLNGPASLIVHDLIRPFKPTLTDRQLLRLTRLTTVVLAIIAVIAGLWIRGIIKVLITFLYFTVAAIPPFVASVFWRKASAEGAFWGMLIGGIVGGGIRFAYLFGLTPPGNLYGLYLPAWLGIVVSTLILVALSLAKPKASVSQLSTVSGSTIPTEIQHIVKLMPW